MAFNWNKETFKTNIGIKAQGTNGSPTQNTEIEELKAYAALVCNEWGWSCDIDEINSYIDMQKMQTVTRLLEN